MSTTAPDRHPSTEHLRRFFTSSHLQKPQRAIAKMCEQLAEDMVADLPDGPELTTGLRKLLEAKDCFVRASLPPVEED